MTTPASLAKKCLKKVDSLGLFGALWTAKGNFAFFSHTDEECFEISCSDGLQWDFQRQSSQLKDKFSLFFGKDEIISEIKIYNQEMWQILGTYYVYHVFMVFKTTNSKTRTETWWSIEKDTLRILIQRSHQERDVTETCWKKEGDWKKTKRPTTRLVLEKNDFRFDADIENVLIYLIPLLKQEYTLTHHNCQQCIADVYNNITGEDWNTPLTEFWQNRFPKSQEEVDREKREHVLLSRFRILHEDLSDEYKRQFDSDIQQFLFTAFKLDWPIPLVKMIIDRHGFDSKSTDEDGRNIFMVACTKQSDLELLCTLKKTTDLKAEDNIGNSIVHCALESSDIKIVSFVIDLLIKNKLHDVIRKRNRRSDNPIHYAIKRGHGVKIVKDLLEKISLYDKDADKNTPLHIAVEMRNKDMVQLLVDNGCNKKVKGRNGKTPHELAVGLGYSELYDITSVKRKYSDSENDLNDNDERSDRTSKMPKIDR